MGGRRFGKSSWFGVAAGFVAVMVLVVGLAGGLGDGRDGSDGLGDRLGGLGDALFGLLRGGSKTSAAGTELRVVTSTSVFADLVANVAGDRAEVSSLIPTGADPHTWEPATAQVRALATADVFFYNGLGLEPWAERTIANIGRRDLMVVRLSEGMEPIGDVSFQVPGQTRGPAAGGHRDHGGGGHAHEAGDPHFWLDINNAMHYVRRIEQALSAADPSGAAYYHAQAERYLAELAELDRWFAAEIERIPPERRVLVTYHDAYGYMTERYGLELVGFLVRNPDREPAPREMAELLHAIEERGVTTIFAEPQVNPRFVEALAREAGVEVGILYTDALTDDVPTYIDMMRTNARALVAGLAGESQP